MNEHLGLRCQEHTRLRKRLKTLGLHKYVRVERRRPGARCGAGPWSQGHGLEPEAAARCSPTPHPFEHSKLGSRWFWGAGGGGRGLAFPSTLGNPGGQSVNGQGLALALPLPETQEGPGGDPCPCKHLPRHQRKRDPENKSSASLLRVAPTNCEAENTELTLSQPGDRSLSRRPGRAPASGG